MTKMLARFLTVLIALPILSNQATAAPLDEVRKIYNTSLGKIDEEHRDRQADVPKAYGQAVSGLARQAQQSGKLDLLLAVKAEQDRFAAERTIPASLPAASPDVVVKNRDKYLAMQDALEIDRALAVIKLTDQYVAHLEKEKQRLTVAGELDEAVAMKAEMSRVVGEAPYTAAQFTLDHAASSQPGLAVKATPPPLPPGPASPPPPEAFSISWSGVRSGNSVTIEHGKTRKRVTLTSQDGNRVEGRSLQCRGGRTLIKGFNEALAEACKATDAITLEISLQTSSIEQTGPARILSFSVDGHHRNVSLCQERERLILRLRTTSTGLNGTSPEVTLTTLEPGKTLDLVITYRPGELHLTVDGRKRDVRQIEGDLSNWEVHQLVLGNEWTGDRPWQGLIHSFSISNHTPTP